MARREITGRKPGTTSGPADEPTPAPPILAMTILQFCAAHAISEGFYYKLKKQDQGPCEMKVGARVLISYESAEAWRRKQEAAAADPDVVARAEAKAARARAWRLATIAKAKARKIKAMKPTEPTKHAKAKRTAISAAAANV